METRYGAEDNALGELIGQLYIEKTFPPEAKERARNIVGNLLISLKERINKLEWMSEDTKKAALVKLAAFTVKIGYPDKWKDYSKVNISRDSYFENDANASEFLTKDNLVKIGKPVDKTEWEMHHRQLTHITNRLEMKSYSLPQFFSPFL